jgi:hypothetical protein
MADQPPPRHAKRYYLIGCAIGGFVAEGIADLVRHNRSKR